MASSSARGGTEPPQQRNNGTSALNGGSNTHDYANALPSPSHQVEQLLQSYEREISSVESSLREMQENLATTRCKHRHSFIARCHLRVNGG